jgi:hypothetical protein
MAPIGAVHAYHAKENMAMNGSLVSLFLLFNLNIAH